MNRRKALQTIGLGICALCSTASSRARPPTPEEKLYTNYRALDDYIAKHKPIVPGENVLYNYSVKALEVYENMTTKQFQELTKAKMVKVSQFYKEIREFLKNYRLSPNPDKFLIYSSQINKKLIDIHRTLYL